MRARFASPLVAFVVILAAANGCSNGGPETPPVPPTWQKFAGNPVLQAGPPGSWDESGVGTPCVRRASAHSYIMWYTGTSAAGSRIGIATSDDGVNWVKDARNPIFGLSSPGTWDALGVSEPCVFLDGTSYVMYYSGWDGTGQKIGLATSSDGIVWVRATADPVLLPQPAGTSWDDDQVYTPWVVQSGSNYTMWYGARGTNGFRATGRAISTDGISWTRFLSPVLDPQVLEALTFGPCVLVSGASFRLWCVALHETTGGHAFPAVVDFAHSVDGVDWTRNRLALSPGEAPAWDSAELQAVNVLDEGSVLKMWYQGRPNTGPSSIGLATQP